MERKAGWLFTTALAALLCLGAAGAARAQQAARVGTSATDSEQQAGNNFHSSFASGELASDSAIVQGAPFAALGVKETTQILSDGTRRVRRASVRLYRDSAGRTRNEWGPQTGPGAAFAPAMLYDAPASTTYMLVPARHSALQLHVPTGAGMRQVKVVTPQSPPDDIRQVVGDRIEPLGTQMIEGVSAEGVRVTSAIQVGGRTDNVVYERWYSQELRRNVLIKCTDPRFGEAVYRLTEISRTEPAQTLFAVPADYKIVPFKATGAPPRTVKSRYQN